MAENLNVSRFRNGDSIPQAQTEEEWERVGNNKQPAWCYYENTSANVVKYGKYYNWYTVNDPRGLAPNGWNIPTDEEWEQLQSYLGRRDGAEKMKSTSGWQRNYDNGNNSGGFSGLPADIRNPKARYRGDFIDIGQQGIWWSSNERRAITARAASLHYNYHILIRVYFHKGAGPNLRCLMD